MDNKTKGAWLLHHGRKIQATTNQDFDAISFASKCGSLLSAVSAEQQIQLSSKRIDALAKANQISPKTEVPAILAEFERQKLILKGKDGFEILGLSSHAVLEHTATIFGESEHESYEEAVLDLSEIVSDMPITSRDAIELISDCHKITSGEALNTLEVGANIGFFDTEIISDKDKLIFNGNLFRKEDERKINAVINSLNQSESSLLIELNAKLLVAGCLPLNVAHQTIGKDLFERLHSIGLFDVSVVGNENGKNYFVTRPAAFSKFTNSIADDALDLAKALVASLTYGMTVSSFYRGRIQMVSLLMNKLIAGRAVGPATEIGNDYQALEYKGVVEVTPANNGMFSMRLLKPEVGRLALLVIQNGDITAETVATLPGAKVTEYINPEVTREVQRKHSTDAMKLRARSLLNEIRTGGLSR